MDEWVVVRFPNLLFQSPNSIHRRGQICKQLAIGRVYTVHREREGEEGHHNTPSLQAPAQGSLTFIRVALKNVFKATQMFLNRGRVGVNSLTLLGTPNSYVSMAYVWPF